MHRRRYPLVRAAVVVLLLCGALALSFLAPDTGRRDIPSQRRLLSVTPEERDGFYPKEDDVHFDGSGADGEDGEDGGDGGDGSGMDEEAGADGQDGADGEDGEDGEGGADEQRDDECSSLTAFEQYGGFVLEMLGVGHVFIGIAIIADDYFISSLEILADKLSMSPDIAGATLMAIGSSAPELFTNVASVLHSSEDAGNDIGAGTIVGSALFNILVVVGLSAYVSPRPMKLAPMPVLRDVFVYILSIAALTYSMWDKTITWVEALVMVCMYVGYIVYLALSRYMVRLLCPSRIKDFEAVEVDGSDVEVGGVEMQPPSPSSLQVPETTAEREARLRKRSFDISHARKGLFRTGSVTPMPDPKDLSRSRSLQVNRTPSKEDVGSLDDPSWTSVEEQVAEGVEIDESDLGKVAGITTGTAPVPEVAVEEEGGDASNENDGDDDGDDGGDDDDGPQTLFDKVYALVAFPYVILFRYTVPDCSEGTGWEKWYLVTFFMSLVWIGLLTYLVVFLMTRIGCALHISTAIMGLTLVAAGTSVPDCIGSVLVARMGEGDMAVSNAVGSNIFDILVGLAVPWLIASLSLHDVPVESDGLKISTLLLMGGLIVYAIVVVVQRFTLRKWTCFVLCAAYICYVVYEISAELLGIHGG